MKPNLTKLLLALSITILTACMTNQTPQEVVQGYWNATIAQDMTKAHDYIGTDTGTDTQKSPAIPNSIWQNATVSFGELKLKNDDAWIDTTINLDEKDKPISLSFTTVLKKDESGWKVNQQQTMKNVQAKRKEMARKDSSVQNLIQRLQTLGEQFTEDMDQAKSDLEKQMPEIKKDIQSLGKNIDKELGEVLKQFKPAIESGFQEFADAINKAIEEAKKFPKEERKPDPTIRSI